MCIPYTVGPAVVCDNVHIKMTYMYISTIKNHCEYMNEVKSSCEKEIPATLVRKDIFNLFELIVLVLL